MAPRTWASAFAVASTVALSPQPAVARPVEPSGVEQQHALHAHAAHLVRAEQVARARPGVRFERRHHGHLHHAPSGGDADLGGATARADRAVALAATWHLDPGLLVPLATDSEATAAARQRLADVYGRLGAALDGYDRARAASVSAGVRARDARTALVEARRAADAAAAQWEQDRGLFVSMINQGHAADSVGAFGMLYSADSEQDLVDGMMLLQELSRTQARVVGRAQRSKDRLDRATAAVDAADRRAQDDLAGARTALTRAREARTRVVEGVREARSLLADSVLADQLARIQARSAAAAAAAAAAVQGIVANGEDVAFPLPSGATFVDQHNFGARSRHWATVHTGDDFSAACGTPVLAATDGTIAIRTDQGWAGPWLVMDSTGPGALTTWYAHMEALLVTDGEQVKAGQPIGVVGQEGNATGCHLHLEVHPTGGSIYEDDTDPGAWLRAVGAYPGS